MIKYILFKGAIRLKKRILPALLALSLVVSIVLISVNAFASDIDWSYNESTKTLTISGSGDMDDYDDAYSMPWLQYISVVENVVIENGVTSVGAYSFAGANHLKSVLISDTVTAVKEYAFSSCTALTALEFSSSVTSIADPSFAYNGVDKKDDFTLKCSAASYPLYYCYKNDISFECESVKCGEYVARINPAGMRAIYPYTAKVSGTFRFYSTGNHDTYGYLYDSNFKQLKSNDDVTSSNTNFSITYNLEKGKTYYFCARIYNTSLAGTLNLFLEPVDYTVNGSIYAMNDPSGAASNILLTDALIDGKASNGQFTYNITSPKTIQIEVGDCSKEYTFSPDDGENIEIVFMMCDINNDHVVNAKDFAIMKKENSKYLPLFDSFINYKY